MSNPVDAKAVFQDTLELPIAERGAFLARACGGDAALRARVEALLAADDEAGAFLASPTGDAGDALDAAPREQPGESIGHFKLQQQIGEGGFGIVWMAEQQHPVRRQVALKIVKRGMDTRSVVARFEQERQALAMMDHQNIAKVFDGGETPAGLPYFVMELVRGVPITQFCDQQQLDAKERLSLFVQVCHAVQHAHQKGIIHRDIKPSNVLVTLHDGVPVPKVIDFGIAKAVHRSLTEKTLFTDFQQMIGTPEYMSPEQAELSGLDIDTRADIYALGVLLYELLTGTLPFDLRKLTEMGFVEMLRTIREDEPQKPSTRISTLGQAGDAVAKVRRTDTQRLGRLLRGDLDWIVMRALEKDRNRRYVSADAFASDVERHLRDEPVEASPPGRLYRLRKYVRRHRVGVTACAFAAAALLLGLSGAIWGKLEADDQRDVAAAAKEVAVEQTKIATAAKEVALGEAAKAATALVRAEAGESAAKKEALRANTVLGFVDRMLTAANPRQVKGSNYRVRQLLDDFARGLGATLSTQPEVEASVRRLIGNAYVDLGLCEKAEPYLTRALELRRQVFGGEHERVAESLQDLVQLRLVGGQLTAAEDLCRQALAMRRQLLDAGDRTIAVSLDALAIVYLLEGRLPEAEDVQLQALDMQRSLSSAPNADIAGCIWGLADIYQARSKFAQAEASFREATDMFRQISGEDDADYASCLDNLGTLLCTIGKRGEAEDLERKALDIHLRIFGEEHPDVATNLSNLAAVLSAQGKFAEAEECCKRALVIDGKCLGEVNNKIAVHLSNLGMALSSQGKSADAEAALRRGLEIQRKVLPAEHPNIATTLHNLSLVVLDQNRPAEAEKLQGEALAMATAVYGEGSPEVAIFLSGLGNVVRIRGRLAEAEDLQRKALEITRATSGEDSMAVADIWIGLAWVLADERRWADAEELLQKALVIRRRVLGDGSAGLRRILSDLALALEFQGKHAEAADRSREALAISRTLFGEADPSVATGYRNLSFILHGAGKLAEVEQIQQRALERARSLVPADELQIATALAELGQTLLEQGKYAGAQPILKECLEIRTARMPTQWSTQLAMSLLGGALAGQGQHAEAEPLLRKGYEEMQPPPEALSRRREALERWIQHYQAWGKPDEAAKWRKVLATEFPAVGK